MVREKGEPGRRARPGLCWDGTFRFVICVLRELVRGKRFPLTKQPSGDSLHSPLLRVLTEFLRTLKRGQVHEFKSKYRRSLHGFRPFVAFFADYELDEMGRELRFKGRPVELESKPLDILLQLLLHAGEVVTKEELL